MDTTRQNKIGKQIQKDLSEILLLHTKKFAPGKMLTVTRVRITPDLSIARTYVSVFPSEKSQEIIDELNLHHSTVRNELGQRIRHQMRIIPEIKFFLDDSLDYFDNIEKLLK